MTCSCGSLHSAYLMQTTPISEAW